ncbi:hypothetical protein [Nocardia arthritidis]|uniref:Alpha/beta hydrolase n=1 Tax=Nocardia arthritidis TaxID=228602 RepID=A0A6G9YHP8_9NOCA|nr:hypothetical protein [Nocardia arthritidis]QIS12473.1 hypothetical protein F5544_23060 [Nocardia arthritidis]
MLRIRSCTAVLTVALLFCGTTTFAAADPEPVPDTPTVATGVDPLYVLRNLVMLLQGYQHDWSNPALLQFWLQHLTSLPGRAGQSLAQLADPAQYQGPDGQQRLRDNIQKLIDTGTHFLPSLAGASLDPADPRYLPNWSNDGVFGQQADSALDSDALDVTQAGNVGRVAKFRYPCTEPADVVFYETRSGDCVSGDTPGADFKLGEARKFQIVDSRGLRLSATLFLPEEALHPAPGQTFPMTVFSDGATAIQSTYYGWTMNAVRRGYLALTYDEAGQGASDGTAADLVVPYNTAHCFASGPCRDLEDVMRWVVGDDILPAPDTQSVLANTTDPVSFWNTVHFPRLGQRRDPAYTPAGDNMRNPIRDLIDTSRIGIWGQSMGSIATGHYLWDVGQGRGMDGRPVPKPAAAVLMSGFEPSLADVPTQIQTADIDIPGMTSGGIFPVNDIDIFGAHLGFDPTDGALGGKSWYDWVRRNRTGSAPLQFLTLEGGSHFDTVGVGMVFPRALESWRNSIDYGIDWFDCTIRGDDAACGRVVTPVPGLSRAAAAEVSPQGPSGPSYCMTVPDNETLVTLLLGPLKQLLSGLYGEPTPQPCVSGQPIPLHP